MNLLQSALELAAEGFHIFPLLADSKKPAILSFPQEACRDPEQIKKWWEQNPERNIGISTTQFGSSGALLGVDIDVKGYKQGLLTYNQLQDQGFNFPETYLQTTPTGGWHLIYTCEKPMRQGTDVFGPGIDVRSKGGYLVGAGSIIGRKGYLRRFKPLVPAPLWMLEKCGAPNMKEMDLVAPHTLDPDSAIQRAIHYLQIDAPVSIQGHGGDAKAYLVAAQVKDYGVEPRKCFELMEKHWNERCHPRWIGPDLWEKVQHAYRYGNYPIGYAAPEMSLSPIEEKSQHPIDLLNQEYAFVTAGGGSHILWQTHDVKGQDRLEHLTIPAFHQKLATKTIVLGDGGARSLSHLWMKSPRRREYDGICFMPGLDAPKQFYNLWRGFAVEPHAGNQEAQEAVQMFLDHALQNVCQNSLADYHYLIGYFAHLVQKPYEKPLVALVFCGARGVGKNALVNRIGHLLGSHYLVSSNRRYLFSNFNGFLENLLLFTLDEAFWSGDKAAEGVLKDLITGNTHLIERKGQEPYSVTNCTRICVISNESWAIPAGADERRFAVYDVGDGRKQDRAYFQAMREGMERGGYSTLLRYLLDYDLSTFDLNAAPTTRGLFEQKLASQGTFYEFWFESLTEGWLSGSDFGQEWQEEVAKDRFRQAYCRYRRERNITGWVEADRVLTNMLRKCLPNLGHGQKRESGERYRTYKLGSLPDARQQFNDFIKFTISWDDPS